MTLLPKFDTTFLWDTVYLFHQAIRRMEQKAVWRQAAVTVTIIFF